MTGIPAPTVYHRWLGWHAPALRRAITVLVAGLIVAVVLLPFVTWGLALTGGWDAAALTFLLGVASLVGAGYALHLAEQHSGASRALLIGAAVLTVVLSWTLINTVYTLRYAARPTAANRPSYKRRRAGTLPRGHVTLSYHALAGRRIPPGDAQRDLCTRGVSVAGTAVHPQRPRQTCLPKWLHGDCGPVVASIGPAVDREEDPDAVQWGLLGIRHERHDLTRYLVHLAGPIRPARG
jgi:hypothetical protein